MSAIILKEQEKSVRKGKIARRRNAFCTQVEDMVFLQNIIHDLKMPLTLIYMDAKEMEKQKKYEDDSKRIKQIKKNCYRIIKLVNDACDSGRIASGNFRGIYKNCDIVSKIKATVDSVQPIAELKKIKLSCEFDVERKIMAMDYGSLERILLNLLSNAFKYSERRGAVKLIFSDLGDMIRIIVRDKGKGFNPKVLEYCFNRYITEYSENNPKGLGIGLSIVRQLVEVMGGEISANNLKQGAEVSLWLPTYADEDPEQQPQGMIVNDFYLDNIVDIEMAGL